MRIISIIAISLFMVFGAYAQDSNNNTEEKQGPYLRFEPSEVNLGAIAVDDVTDDLGNIDIKVHNDGNEPLLIAHVRACCGTQVKEWPREPIAPGASGSIKVYFRVAPRVNRISRTVTVMSNATNGESLRVAILGEVVIPTTSSVIELK